MRMVNLRMPKFARNRKLQVSCGIEHHDVWFSDFELSHLRGGLVVVVRAHKVLRLSVCRPPKKLIA